MQQYQSLIMIALLVVGFYFLILRPQKRRQQAIQKTLRELEPGTRVLLNSGLFGTITAIGDRQTQVEIAPGVEITVLKQAIARAVTATDEDLVEYEDDDFEVEHERLDAEPISPVSTLDLPPGHTTDRPANTPAAEASDTYQPSSTYVAPEVESDPSTSTGHGSTSTGSTNPNAR